MESRSPVVSIVMSAFNEEKYLPECLESIRSQSLTDWELIIVNDGSTDNTGGIIRRFQSDFPQKVHCLHSNRKGTGACVNKALVLAKGKYIARMDADDTMCSSRLEKQVNYLERNPGINVLGTAASLVNDRGQEIGIRKNPVDDSTIRRRITQFEFPIIHPSVMIRSELFAGIRYRERIMASVDLGLWLDLLRDGVFANLEETLINKRVHSESITGHSKKGIVVQFRTTVIAIEHCLSVNNIRLARKLIVWQLALLLLPNPLLHRTLNGYRMIRKIV